MTIDGYIVMPNHVHGIIIINDNDVGAPPCGRPIKGTDHDRKNVVDPGQAQGPAPTEGRLSLGDIVRRFGTFTMNRYIKGVKTKHWRPFPGKLWQRNYHDHIIRNDKELNDIREYIINNPLKWNLDQDNPDNWKGNNRSHA